MESVTRARERLAKYPLVFAKCSKQSILYARCVLLKEGSVAKNDCAAEFEQFKNCLTLAAKDLKTRI